jgi:phosphoribulokinase
MSRKHPILAITGSSGAGTTTVRKALEQIFAFLNVSPVTVEGDSFHRYTRKEMREQVALIRGTGRNLSHFGPEGNLFERQEALFKEYAESGKGERRYYIHDAEEAKARNQDVGTFTPWEPLPEGTDLLVYEGLHGGVVTESVDMAQYVDLLIGVAPTVNLEWIQKIHRDTEDRGYDSTSVVNTILRRMHDYMHYIIPQFSRTHINFQRIPLVDTSNPLKVRCVPTLDQSIVLIHFLKPRVSTEYKLQLKGLIEGTCVTGFNTIIVPGGKMMFAMEFILTERIQDILRRRDRGG